MNINSSEIVNRIQLSLQMKDELFSARLFDAKGVLSKERIEEINYQFALYNNLHIINTSLYSFHSLLPLMAQLGFSAKEQFKLGGRTSRDWQEKWVAPGLRRMDFYPSHLYLLPNNEIQYLRSTPERVLFFCNKISPNCAGGRTFIHSAKEVEHNILKASKVGKALLKKLREFGITIETGYLDKRHPSKNKNYFQSWQEKFLTNSIDEALERCKNSNLECDNCWIVREKEKSILGEPLYTLMTQITLPAFVHDKRDNDFYIRFPRIALDKPSIVNGYRRFPLGNGIDINSEEKQILLEAYLVTRQGIDWSQGNFILLDNIRFGHSRESYTGEREILLSMAGTMRIEDNVSKQTENSCQLEKLLRDEVQSPYQMPIANRTNSYSSERYFLPSNPTMWNEQVSMRIFDMRLTTTANKLLEARQEFEKYGNLHIINTGIKATDPGALPINMLDSLGFTQNEQFIWGGQLSGRTTRESYSKFIRATDLYPSERVLLPHNEILYQRFMPERLLFFSARPAQLGFGGRTFIHSALQVEKLIAASGLIGEQLLKKLEQHGMMIETGFLDEKHPDKAKNYLRSWQDRFNTKSKDKALELAQKNKLQFDEAWWKIEKGQGDHFILMTRITIPAYKIQQHSNQRYLLLPRIALDEPSLNNGYRRFLLGNGDELTQDEIDVLLKAYWKSRQGWFQQEGDILLVDNIRFGHSRESFIGPRKIGVSMAGLVWSDDVPKNRRLELVDLISDNGV